MLVFPGLTEASKDGTAEYRYKVTDVDYNAIGNMTAARGAGCLPGYSASWVGRAITGFGELAELSKYGTGYLHIGRNGTTGNLGAKFDTTSNLEDAEHTLTTACDQYGQTDYATTPCSVTGQRGEMAVAVHVKGAVGTRLKVSWKFNQLRGKGGWVPQFACASDPFIFPNPKCTTKQKLNRFTRKQFKLSFNCSPPATLAPPQGTDYYLYFGQVLATGALKLKRTSWK